MGRSQGLGFWLLRDHGFWESGPLDAQHRALRGLYEACERHDADSPPGHSARRSSDAPVGGLTPSLVRTFVLTHPHCPTDVLEQAWRRLDRYAVVAATNPAISADGLPASGLAAALHQTPTPSDQLSGRHDTPPSRGQRSRTNRAHDHLLVAIAGAYALNPTVQPGDGDLMLTEALERIARAHRARRLSGAAGLLVDKEHHPAWRRAQVWTPKTTSWFDSEDEAARELAGRVAVHHDPQMRTVAALTALGTGDLPRWWHLLSTMTNDPSPIVRRAIAEKAAAVPMLEVLASDSDPTVRRRVAANNHSPYALLQWLAQDRDHRVRRAATDGFSRVLAGAGGGRSHLP